MKNQPTNFANEICLKGKKNQENNMELPPKEQVNVISVPEKEKGKLKDENVQKKCTKVKLGRMSSIHFCLKSLSTNNEPKLQKLIMKLKKIEHLYLLRML